MRSEVVTISTIASLTGHGDKLCESLKRISAESFIGRKQLIVGVQLGLNLFFKFGTAFGINARDAGTPEGTHGFAFKNGNFSSVGFGGLWF